MILKNPMARALVVGGSNGIGLALVQHLLKRGYEKIYIVDRCSPDLNDVEESLRTQFLQRTQIEIADLSYNLSEVFDRICDIDTLLITAGFGRVAPFDSLVDREIENLIQVNFMAATRLIVRHADKLTGSTPFYCAVMGSIAGHIVSPLFSVYGAAKAGICSFIESVNAELAHRKSPNRILNVSPGSLKGTRFRGGQNALSELDSLCDDILERMYARETLYIPEYESIFKGVINRYRESPLEFGQESYHYKIPRISPTPQMVVGYLSGTFDLFHIGHLNLLRRARAECDYLIVGVHKSGAWKGKETFIPFEERKAIVRSIRYVDEVIESYTEDIDAWQKYHYNKLFVGSDYKGSERFERYEDFFRDKNAQIIYFPYTTQTSSTQLRKKITD